MKNTNRFVFTFLLCTLFALPYAFAQPITSAGIDTVAANAMKAFNVPGIAVGVVKDGKLIHAKGYGVRSLNTQLPVDAYTLFGIASNSKAMTAATIGMLVDQGKLTWETKVREVIPEFELYDPYVTAEFTIKDLLTHRSGLRLGAGDLMFFPDPSEFTTADIISNLKYLKPVSSFRSKYDYNNNMYNVAGEVVARISGMPWTEFVEKNIFQPLGMTASATLPERIKDKSNMIDGHCPVDGKVVVIQRSTIKAWAPAAGVNSNINDLSKWVIAMLHKGKYGTNLQDTLISDEVWNEMTSPQMIIPLRSAGSYNTKFSTYGLGFRVLDVMGYKEVNHTGGLEGMVTQITMLPELDLGIITLTNQQEGGAFASITNQIKDSYLGVTGTDRVKEYAARRAAGLKSAEEIVNKAWEQVAISKKNKVQPALADFAGTYADNWFGNVNITLDKEGLYFASVKSPRMKGRMYFYKANTFIIKWDDRSFDADAYATFTLDRNGKATGFTVEAISPLTDFSFDFEDLDMKRMGE